MLATRVFFNDTATTEIYTLSLHDALPIYRPDGGEGDHRQHAAQLRHERSALRGERRRPDPRADLIRVEDDAAPRRAADRKSTRLNSSHSQISYAVFCLKKKKSHNKQYYRR